MMDTLTVQRRFIINNNAELSCHPCSFRMMQISREGAKASPLSTARKEQDERAELLRQRRIVRVVWWCQKQLFAPEANDFFSELLPVVKLLRCHKLDDVKVARSGLQHTHNIEQPSADEQRKQQSSAQQHIM